MSRFLPAHSAVQSLFQCRFSVSVTWSHDRQDLMTLNSPVLTFCGKAEAEKLRNALGPKLLKPQRERKKKAQLIVSPSWPTSNLPKRYFHYVLQNSQNKPCYEHYQVSESCAEIEAPCHNRRCVVPRRERRCSCCKSMASALGIYHILN